MEPINLLAWAFCVVAALIILVAGGLVVTKIIVEIREAWKGNGGDPPQPSGPSLADKLFTDD